MTRPEAATSGSHSHCRPRDRTKETDELDIEDYIPPYLRRFITPYHGEFCYTRTFHFRLVAHLMLEGFLPIANEHVILPKLHHERCVIPLQQPGAFHVPKSIRKKSKKFTFSVNQCFDRVVDECRKQHGTRCWLYPELVRVFREIHQANWVDCVVVPRSTPPDGSSENKESATSGTAAPQTQEVAPVRLYSIEVWNEATGELAAGELGYTVGSIYTSLTGFAAQDGAGSVQLAALGRLLSSLGFTLWDLGMDMQYKKGLGSQNMSRKDFVAHVHQVRSSMGHLVLSTTKYQSDGSRSGDIDEPFPNCKSIIDLDMPTPPAASRHNLTMLNDGALDMSDTTKQQPSHKPPTPELAASPAPCKKKRKG